MALAEVRTDNPVRDITTDILSLCKCEECPLDGTRVLGEGSDDYYEVFRTVPVTDPEGNVTGHRQKKFLEADPKYKYDVVLVGMAPAREEIAYKRTFIGPSGRLLRATLDSLEYCPYYVTNCSLCMFPYGTDEKEYTNIVQFCKDRLFAEIEMLNPSLVVALGNLPLSILSGRQYKITKMIGRVINDTAVGYPVVGVTHPASILRRTEGHSDFVFGLGRALEHAYGNVVVAPSPEMTVVTPDNLGDFLQRLENAGEATVDLETTTNGLFPYGRYPDKIRCTGVGLDKSMTWIVPGHPSAIHGSDHVNLCQHPHFIEVLDKIRGIYHNGMFDCGFLYQAGFKPILSDDTFLMHYMIDERGKGAHGLKKLAYRYLSAPDWETDLGDWKGPNETFDKIPDDVLYRYCAHDVSYTGQLRDIFRDKMGTGSRVYNDLLMPCANMFNEIRQDGIPIDIQVLMEMDEELEREMYRLEVELRDLCGMWINPCSTYQVGDMLYDIIGIPETADYGRSTSKNAMELYREHPIVEKVLEYRALNKLRGAYVNNFAEFLDWNLRVHPLVKLFAAVTGRIASEDPAIMNIPKKGPIKKMFIPEPGMEILEIDQAQMELRCYAVLGNDDYLTDLLLADEDPHALVAAESIKRMHKEDVLTAEEFRRPAKTAVFGRLYGRSKKSIMHSFGLTWDDTNALVKVIDSLFPNIGDYNLKTKQAVHLDHSLTSFFGRQRRFTLITEESRHELYRQAANFPVQCLVPETRVLTNKGYTMLKNVTVGDTVWTGAHWAPVSFVGHTKKPLCTLELSNGAEPHPSPDHKFLVKSKGWVTTKHLKERDELTSINGDKVTVVRVIQTEEMVPMMDITVDHPDHSFVAEGVVTHNSMASDINLYCMLAMYNDPEIRSWGIHPKWPVHDAIVFFVESREHIGKLQKRMEEYCNDLVGARIRFKSDMEIGPNWGSMEKLKC